MKDTNNKDFDFSKRAGQYDVGVEGKFARKFYEALLSQVEPKPGESLLDVGCGTGYLLNAISKQSAIIGYGIDAEKEMVMVAKQACREMNIQVSSCDATPFADASFDTVIACMAYHHFANKPGFIKETSRILKPNGILYIADPRFPWVIRKALNGALRLFRVVGEFFTPDEILAQFKAGGFKKRSIYAKGYVQVVAMKKVSTS